MKLINLMEPAVFRAIDDAQNQEDFCSCEKCRMDIAAIALNSLPNRYVVTDIGSAYGRAEMLELQKDVDILSAVVKGIILVSKNPRHS